MTTAQRVAPGLRNRLIGSLNTCATEVDIVQVLYAALHPLFGYDVVNLHVLEREGWYHAFAVDSGVLQDVRRRHLSESVSESLYEAGRTVVVHPNLPEGDAQVARGGGFDRYPRTVIFVPIEHRGALVGSVSYQTIAERVVRPDEISFLEEIHSHLGVLIVNAHLNQTTRNQALSLSALNEVARALSATRTEAGVVAALDEALAQLFQIDRLVLVVRDPAGGRRARSLTMSGRGGSVSMRRALPFASLGPARPCLEIGASFLRRGERVDGSMPSEAWVAIRESGEVRGALSIQAAVAGAYEESTVSFLEQVADQVSLALRNAWSYTELETQRRRLEVVNAVGRRLASSLDRWSIMRTLREELARHLEFDGFILATVRVGPDGPLAEGYGYDSGVEQPMEEVPLAVAGPSREAYETGQPVLVRRSPWASHVEAQHPERESLVVGRGAAVYVTRAARSGKVATRSMVWVPVRDGARTTALLSLQSYRRDVFGGEQVQLLLDVAAHVGLALANADHYTSAQSERRRLEALHKVEMGVAGSTDERQISESLFDVVPEYLRADRATVRWVDAEGLLAGFTSSPEGAIAVDRAPAEDCPQFRRLAETAATLAEASGSDHALWVPVTQGGRVAACICAERSGSRPFGEEEVRLLESAAPVIGIALRTVRLHRANELALAHSLRIQEVAALAGHDLQGVVASIAAQARGMLGGPGAACWAFDLEGRVAAFAGSGDAAAGLVLGWSNFRPAATGPVPPVRGRNGEHSWTLIPLSFSSRQVGAIGAVASVEQEDEPAQAALDFASHAALAIENARLAQETRGRISALEAVAGFSDLDPTRPETARASMAGLVARALSDGSGALWLAEGEELVRADGARRLAIEPWLAGSMRAEPADPRLRAFLRRASGPGTVGVPVTVAGRLAGLVTSRAPAAEARRLMTLLAGQVGVMLGRLDLLDVLDRERRMMNAILRHSPVGVVLEDGSGRIIFANPAVERVYLMPPEAMTGMTVAELLQESGAIGVPGTGSDLGDGLEYRVRERVILVRRVPIPGLEGESGGLLTLHEDVTEQRQVLEAKELMLRAIGHEVRSPAAAMRGSLAVLLQWESAMDAQRRHVLIEEAYEMSGRLLSLVEGQLIISKLETGGFEPQPVPVAVEEAVAQTLAILRSRYSERVDRVDVHLGAGLPPALCEPTHLDQVLANLVGNALEYSQGQVEVTAVERRDWLEVRVADTGPGVPAERVAGLFDKTMPAGRNRARGGLGLGLYLCRLVVERSFAGRIWYEGVDGGATFAFTVPALSSGVPAG